VTTPRRAAVCLTAATLLVLSAGCDSAAEKKAEAQARADFSRAADLSTCAKDARAAATPYPDGFPTDWPFPDRTVVFSAQDRGADGVVVSAISKAPFKDALATMNGPVAKAGYKVEKGETEQHDAEAEWSGNGFHGRWAIRESATCPGETVVQVLSTHS